MSAELDRKLFRLADLAAEVRGAGDEARRLRLVFEFLRAATDDLPPVRPLVTAEPEPTGDPRFDALLAVIAEDLCLRSGTYPPEWANDRRRLLDGFWWVSDLPSARARALVHAPAPIAVVG